MVKRKYVKELADTDSVLEHEAIPPDILLKILLVERRDNAIYAIEHYYQTESGGAEGNIDTVRSRIISLWFDVKASLDAANLTIPPGLGRDLSAVQYKLITTDDVGTLLSIFDFLSGFLYEKGVLKYDNRLVYDKTNIELSNKIHGYG